MQQEQSIHGKIEAASFERLAKLFDYKPFKSSIKKKPNSVLWTLPTFSTVHETSFGRCFWLSYRCAIAFKNFNFVPDLHPNFILTAEFLPHSKWFELKILKL